MTLGVLDGVQIEAENDVESDQIEAENDVESDHNETSAIDPAFEFSAPRYCNLARELDSVLRYGDEECEEHAEWFERAHPRHEPEAKNGDGLSLGLDERDPRGAADGAPDIGAPTPPATPKPSAGTRRTPLTGSARRVTRGRRHREERGEEGTRRVLDFDELVDPDQGADELVPGGGQQKQIREVELMLRKHNRQLEARKREQRQTRNAAADARRPRQPAQKSVHQQARPSAPNDRAPRGTSPKLRTTAATGADPELRKMLMEHNRKVREARKSRTTQARATDRDANAPPAKERRSRALSSHNVGKGSDEAQGAPPPQKGEGQSREARPTELAGSSNRPDARATRSAAANGTTATSGTGTRRGVEKAARIGTDARSAQQDGVRGNRDQKKPTELAQPIRRRTASKVDFTAAVRHGPHNPVHRRKTDAHSELTELLKEHNSRVRSERLRSTR